MEDQDNKIPRVSIGIPIYHGEIYLEDTLKSLLKQTYRDFEIILADNNPGGAAEEVAKRYSAKYPFIRYIQHPKNIGALQNWNSLIGYSRGEYFICSGGHDLLSENFLERTVEILDRYPAVVLAYAPTRFINVEGEEFDQRIGLLDTSGQSLVSRFIQTLWGNQEALYGLMRLDCIRRTRLQKEIVGSGAVWLSEISIFGEFYVCPDIIRYRRANREQQKKEEQLRRYHTTLFSRKRIRILPHWRIPYHYFLACFAGKMPFSTRFRLITATLFSSLVRYLPNMLGDIWSVIVRFPQGKFY